MTNWEQKETFMMRCHQYLVKLKNSRRDRQRETDMLMTIERDIQKFRDERTDRERADRERTEHEKEPSWNWEAYK